MATLDSGLLMTRMLRAIVDLVSGPTMDLVTTSPAPVQAPSSSMNVEVNVSAVNPETTRCGTQMKTRVGGHGTNPLVRLFRMRITLMTNGNNHLLGISHGKAKNTVTPLNH